MAISVFGQDVLGGVGARTTGRIIPRFASNGASRYLPESSKEWEKLAREFAPVPSRLALGSTMTYHGARKLNPEGFRSTVGFFESVGIKPGKFWAAAVGVTEAAAGICFLAGIATRPAAVGVLATQAVAIATVHKDKGFQNEKGGFEFNLALMAIALDHLITGPGKVSTYGGVKLGIRRRKNWYQRYFSFSRPRYERVIDWIA